MHIKQSNSIVIAEKNLLQVIDVFFTIIYLIESNWTLRLAVADITHG